MLYQINPNVQYRRESFGGIVEGYGIGLKILNIQEYELFLSFGKPLLLKEDQLKGPFLQELIDNQLLVEVPVC